MAVAMAVAAWWDHARNVKGCGVHSAPNSGLSQLHVLRVQLNPKRVISNVVLILQCVYTAMLGVRLLFALAILVNISDAHCFSVCGEAGHYSRIRFAFDVV